MLAIALPLAAFLAVLVLHAIVQRLFAGAPPQRNCILACLAGFAPLGAALALFHLADLGTLLYVALVYVCVVYSYFHLFNMSETARRIRLVREIDQRGAVTVDEIARAYSENEVVDTRLARMTGMGHLTEKDGRYHVGSRVLYIAARILDAWRDVLGYEAPSRSRG